MANFFTDNDDLRFYVEHGIPWEEIVTATELRLGEGDAFRDTAEAVETYKDILTLIGELAAERIAPHAKRIDAEGVRFKDGEVTFPPTLQGIHDAIAELELHRLCLPRELEGMNSPFVLYLIACELISRADPSVMAHFGFHGGIAMALLLFSIREGTTAVDPETRTITSTRFAGPIAEIASGAAWGCMDITEPDAGSDMAALRTRAEQGEDGRWYVSGQKIFITSGHGKYHFVIARTAGEAGGGPDAQPMAGLEGLSMFLVPAWEDGPEGRRRLATLGGVEEKLGHHASATATIHFDRTPAELIGEPGQGFQYMLTMMNSARVGVGFESLGLCEAAYRLAATYAAERRSMGKTIDRHEMIADYLEEMRTDIQGIRALAMEAAFHEELAQKLTLQARFLVDEGSLEARRLAETIARHKRYARQATPLLKYIAAEKAVEMARRAIQIHGGVGYTTEYGAEKLLRDAVVMPIYEGTSQIQALMAMKDRMTAIIKAPQRFVRRMARDRWRSLSSRDPLERRVARLAGLGHQALQHLITRTAAAKLGDLRRRPIASWPKELRGGWDPKRDFGFALLHAERLTRLLTDDAIAQTLWRQAARFPERREVLERHLERAEPRARFLLDAITSTGGRLIRQLHGEDDAEELAAS